MATDEQARTANIHPFHRAAHRYVQRGNSVLTAEEAAEVREVIGNYPEVERVLTALARRGFYLLPLDVLRQAQDFAAALQAISFGWGADPQATASEILPPSMARSDSGRSQP